MDAQSIMYSDEFRRCADFHGHICPGLAIGYKAAKLALERLKESRAEDEEIVAIVDVRAVQIELPARARVEPSEACSRCGEPTMRTKLQSVDGKKLCRGCLG